MKDLNKLEEKLNLRFKNKKLLQEALTHRSYLNENPDFPNGQNERLEFLGDAVLELIVTDYLFRGYPEEEEGWLTAIRAALVNYLMLARVARGLALDKFILLSRGEAKDFGRAREVILANALEAIIGAIYLDGGYEVASRFVKKFILTHLEEVIEQKLYRDPKSTLQEIIQEKFKVTPTYRVLEEKGPDHNREFQVGVFFGEELKATGTGPSKQEAEVQAAEEALKTFKG